MNPLEKLFNEIKNFSLKDYQYRLSKETLTQEQLEMLNNMYIEHWSQRF